MVSERARGKGQGARLRRYAYALRAGKESSKHKAEKPKIKNHCQSHSTAKE